jgi:hypothetical protein
MPQPKPTLRNRASVMPPAEALKYVREIEGEPLRLLVPSRTHRNAEYLVDLEEYDFNGACVCQDFEMRHQPLLVRGAKPDNQMRCWHILIARTYFLNRELRAAAARMRGNQCTTI